MLIGYFAEYQGIRGTIEYDVGDCGHTGRLLVNNALVQYSGKEVTELYEAFKDAVDSYLLAENKTN